MLKSLSALVVVLTFSSICYSFNLNDCDESDDLCLIEKMDDNRLQDLEIALFEAIEFCAENHTLSKLSSEELKDKMKLKDYMDQAQKRVQCEKEEFDKISLTDSEIQVIFNKNLERNETRILISFGDGLSFYDIFDAPFRDVRGTGHYIVLENAKYRLIGNTDFDPRNETHVNSVDPLNNNLTVDFLYIKDNDCGDLTLPQVRNSKLGVLGSSEFLRVDVLFSVSEGSQLIGNFVELQDNGVELRKDEFERTYGFQSVLGRPTCK